MVVHAVEQENIKSFMQKLLKGDMFDSFLLRSAEIETYITISINGTLVNSTTGMEKTKDDSERLVYCEWKRVKPVFFELIKGSQKPKSIKLILAKRPDELSQIAPNAAALFINIHFENDEIKLTTGCGQKTFTLDKSVEFAWDDAVGTFLSKNQIISTLVE